MTLQSHELQEGSRDGTDAPFFDMLSVWCVINTHTVVPAEHRTARQVLKSGEEHALHIHSCSLSSTSSWMVQKQTAPLQPPHSMHVIYDVRMYDLAHSASVNGETIQRRFVHNKCFHTQKCRAPTQNEHVWAHAINLEWHHYAKMTYTNFSIHEDVVYRTACMDKSNARLLVVHQKQNNIGRAFCSRLCSQTRCRGSF